jgi:hypothetical protein
VREKERVSEREKRRRSTRGKRRRWWRREEEEEGEALLRPRDLHDIERNIDVGLRV